MRASLAMVLVAVACAGCHSRKVHHRIDPIRINIAAQPDGKPDTWLGDALVKAMIAEGTAAYELGTGCLGYYAREGRWPENLLELEQGLRHINPGYGPLRRLRSYSVKQSGEAWVISFVGTDGSRGDVSVRMSPLK